MANYALDNLDIQNLITIIDRATITGNMAETILSLKQKLRSPIEETKTDIPIIPDNK